MKRAAALLLTPVLLAQAPRLAPPDLAQRLSRSREPILLIFAPPREGKDLTQAQVTAEEALEKVQIQTYFLTGARPESRSLAKALQTHLKLGEARWALVLEGRVLAQGIPPLTLPALKALVEGSGFKPPTQQLRAFLKRRPDHLEARLSLLWLLRRRAEVRTEQALGPATLAKPIPKERGLITAFDHLPQAEARLKPEDDLRIWGETYRELDQVLQNGDWLCMNLEQWIGRSSPIEAASPLMRGLYQRHRPRLLATLRETPQDRNVLSLWAHTSVVLGEPLAPILESLPSPYPVADRSALRSAWPGASISKLLASEARRQQDWPRLARLLGTLWLDGQGTRRMRSYSGAKLWSAEWRAYGLPALEAQIQARTPEGADALLEAASEAPNASELLGEAVSLAQRLGRGDLAQAWEHRPIRLRMPENMTWYSYFRITTSQHPESLFVTEVNGPTTSTRQIHARSLDPKASASPEMAQAWRRFLGWSPQDQRWAVLDRTGKVILEGTEPMDKAQAQKALDALKLTWEAPFITEPSDAADLWTRTEGIRSKLQRVIEKAPIISKLLGGIQDAPIMADPGQVAAWLQPLRAMDDILEGGLWRRDHWQWFQDGPEYPLNLPEAASLARTWTQALEAELVRRPRSHALWSLWSQWVALVPDPDFRGLEGRLERDPMEVGGPWDQAWPPPLFLSTQKQHHAFYGRWRQLEQLVRPRWDKAKGEAEGKAESRAQPEAARALWQEFGVPLAQALWKQDRVADVDRLLAEALSLGLDREFLVRRIPSQTFKDLIAHWNPRPDKPGSPR